MSSKKLKPLAWLFQQWSSQEESSSYRLLLQSTNSLATRLQAAETVENPDLYERAGVRTPSETAIRDIIGGYAWFDHLVELALKYFSGNLVFLATKPQESKLTTKLLQEANNNNKITVIQTSIDPWGWDEECIENKPSLNNLQELFTSLHTLIQQQPKTILIWESLSPLLAVHGFEKVHLLLNHLKGCFQIWPIRMEVLTPLQHEALEDSAQALLHLKEGEMTMLRQGVREKGNIVRLNLPFRLTGEKLVELENEEDLKSKQKEETVNKEGSSKKDSASNSATPSSRSKKIQLKLEDDNEKASTPSNNLPRIYLQDDDPEFDDMDEEDPDDDLDI